MLNSKLYLIVPFSILQVVGHAATISATAGSTTITYPGTITFEGPGVDGTVGISFGSVSVQVSANCGAASDCSTGGSGAFSDTITILGAAGILKADISASSWRMDSGGGGGVGYQLGEFAGYQNWLGPAVTNITPGVPIVISALAFAYAADLRPMDPWEGSNAAGADVAFHNFMLLDSTTNQPLSGFRYTSESGTDYGISGGTFFNAPEPMTAALIGIGSVLLLCLRRPFQRAALCQEAPGVFRLL